jgi:quercetin dioxygenase-like cupin family protein
MWRTALAAGVIAFSAGAAAAQVNSAQMDPADLKWGPAPAILPKGAQMAVLSGDPGKPGIFVIRVKMPAGYRIAAHHHPTDEYVTVISGDFRLGMGDKLDPAKATALTAGGFAVAPKGMNHFAWSKTGAVIQVNMEGPFVLVYVNPADDPSRKAGGR